ncbi:MAG: molybdenum cofactor guanylyltransferase [Actinobacteria bacterium]|nr:molybdenum cofactor guanylyltransferase [Actinomycetota bacterium]
MGDSRDPIGVVLAGGAGRRIGGGKAVVELHGRPLVRYPLAALQTVLAEVVVVAKQGSALPPLPGVPIWIEPAEPRHPLAGIVHALEGAGAASEIDGLARDVLVCAADMPFVGLGLLERLVSTDIAGARALVPRAAGRLQPLLARYAPAAYGPLAAALREDPLPSLTHAVAALDPCVLDVADERAFFNVNAPEDLLTAAGLLDRVGESGWTSA